jgi:hypothetical protein
MAPRPHGDVIGIATRASLDARRRDDAMIAAVVPAAGRTGWANPSC